MGGEEGHLALLGAVEAVGDPPAPFLSPSSSCPPSQSGAATPLGFAYRPSLAPITADANPFAGSAFPTVLLENMAHIK